MLTEVATYMCRKNNRATARWHAAISSSSAVIESDSFRCRPPGFSSILSIIGLVQCFIGTKRDKARGLRQSALSLLHRSPYAVAVAVALPVFVHTINQFRTPSLDNIFSLPCTLPPRFIHHLRGHIHLIFLLPVSRLSTTVSRLSTRFPDTSCAINLKATKTSRQRGPAASCSRHPRLIRGRQPLAQLRGGCLRLRAVNTPTHRYFDFRRLFISAWAQNDQRSRDALKRQQTDKKKTTFHFFHTLSKD